MRIRLGQSQSHRKCVGNEAGLLTFVTHKCAYGRAGASVATCVGNFGAKECSQSRFDERPCPHILWFFLAPDELRSFWEWFEHFAKSVFSERIKLLDANDRGILDFPFATILQKIVKDLPGAKDDALHVVDRISFR